MILQSIALGALQGIASGIGERYRRAEERAATRHQNSILEQSARKLALSGSNTQLTNNQGAAGNLGYLAYRNKLSPQMLETFAQMYSNRINSGIQAKSQADNQAAIILSQRKPMLTSGKNDLMAGILRGLDTGVTRGLNVWAFLDELNQRKQHGGYTPAPAEPIMDYDGLDNFPQYPIG